jgi:kumamolisin
MSGHPLAGSERKLLAGAQSLGRADRGERFEVSVLIRRQNLDAFNTQVEALTGTRGQRGKHFSRADFARRFSALPADITAVKAFATAHGLVVVGEHPARRTLVLSGTVAQFESAFEVELNRYQHDKGTYRGRVGSIQIPENLVGVIEAVLGLDNRPQAEPHFRLRKPRPGSPPAATPTSFTPLQVASLYQFPAGTGSGECVGIIELGGGYRPEDLATYFKALGVGSPDVVAVSVDQANNSPTGDANGPDGEVMLDIEVVGALVPQAKIAVYFAPNTDAGFIDAVTTAAHDTTNNPSVLSISWGGPESTWTPQSSAALDSAFQAAIAMGITVCTASGDNGSADGVSDGADHVDFPSSSPHVLACGGTSLTARGSSIASEVVWNDGANGGASGGGVSTVFALPAWQEGLKVTSAAGATQPLSMRGVPDVSGDADPETGYSVRIDGTDTVIGGTSAVAPLWAALITRLNAAAGTPLGFVNPALYQSPGSLNDIVSGNNGDFSAASGWDACTGLGSPNGSRLKSL